MTYQIKVSLSAQNDLSNIASFILIDSGSKEQALSYLSKIEQMILSLNQFPERGSIPRYRLLVLQGYRFLSVESHLIFYKINKSSKEVIIYRIIHSKQAYHRFL